LKLKVKAEGNASCRKFSKETGVARQRKYPEGRNIARWERCRTGSNLLTEGIRKDFERRTESYSCKRV
jgi:hypothetical protein